jgi:hypothetical protein
MDEDDDALTALAHELLTEKGIENLLRQCGNLRSGKQPLMENQLLPPRLTEMRLGKQSSQNCQMPSELEVARSRGRRIPSSADQLTCPETKTAANDPLWL